MNNNIFNGQQPYYPYGFNAAALPVGRPDSTAYMMPQPTQPMFIKGRPVSSFEEARVAQVDLDGSTFIFPDLGNKRIYTKRINADGTATLQSFVLEEVPVEAAPAYATKEEISSLKATLDEIVAKLKVNSTPTQTQKVSF